VVGDRWGVTEGEIARQRRGDARRAVGVEVVFAEPVPGPLSLGALSHFGLGLFVPRE